jgi:hypothetical protein
MFGLELNGCFCDGHTMYGCDHDYGFTSSVGHPRSDLVKMLVSDCRR